MASLAFGTLNRFILGNLLVLNRRRLLFPLCRWQFFLVMYVRLTSAGLLKERHKCSSSTANPISALLYLVSAPLIWTTLLLSQSSCNWKSMCVLYRRRKTERPQRRTIENFRTNVWIEPFKDERNWNEWTREGSDMSRNARKVKKQIPMKSPCYASINSKLQHPPGIWTLEDWIVQIPAPSGQKSVQMPYPIVEFFCQGPSSAPVVFLWSWCINMPTYVLWPFTW